MVKNPIILPEHKNRAGKLIHVTVTFYTPCCGRECETRRIGRMIRCAYCGRYFKVNIDKTTFTAKG